MTRYIVSPSINFNTGTGKIASGSIAIDIGGDDIIDYYADSSTNLTSGNGYHGIFAQFLANGTTQYRFAGDLVVPDSSFVTAFGSRALSLFAGNNAYIGENVDFNLSGGGQAAGAGGGTGGTYGENGSAGTGGTDGGNGGHGGEENSNGGGGGGSGTGTGAGGGGGGSGESGNGTSGLSGSGTAGGGGGGGGGGEFLRIPRGYQ